MKLNLDKNLLTLKGEPMQDKLSDILANVLAMLTIGTQTISYSGTIALGEKLIIDTENITAELDGINVVDNLSGDLPLMLQSGNTSVTADSKVTIIFRDRWV